MRTYFIGAGDGSKSEKIVGFRAVEVVGNRGESHRNHF